MSKIVNLYNRGKKSIKTGIVRVNSLNVYPTTITATAAGASTLTLDLLDGYEFFNVAQTSAGTDFINLPAGSDIGTILELYATSACKVKCESGSTVNGVANSTQITLAANSLSTMTKVTSTKWLLQQAASNGAITSPVN